MESPSIKHLKYKVESLWPKGSHTERKSAVEEDTLEKYLVTY